MGLFSSKPAAGANNSGAKTPTKSMFKTLLAANNGVGKTCLLRALQGEPWSDVWISTIGVDFVFLPTKLNKLAGEHREVKLMLWDTAGREKFRSITPSYYRGAQVVLHPYAIDDRSSFEHIVDFIEAAKQHAAPGVELVLVSTKQDLADRREVSEEEGQALADFHGAHYIATSAKTNQGIEELHDFIESVAARVLELPVPAPAATPKPAPLSAQAEAEGNAPAA